MSTYYDVDAELRLDVDAAARWRDFESFAWFSDLVDGAYATPGSWVREDGCAVCVDTDDAVLVTVSPVVAQRNLGRFLLGDLVMLAQSDVGSVIGNVIMCCSDGTSSREVLQLTSSSVLYGAADCLNAAVELVHPKAVPVHDMLRNSSAVDALPKMFWIVPGDVPTGVAADPGPLQDCWCAGWVEELDRGLCTTRDPVLVVLRREAEEAATAARFDVDDSSGR